MCNSKPKVKAPPPPPAPPPVLEQAAPKAKKSDGTEKKKKGLSAYKVAPKPAGNSTTTLGGIPKKKGV